MFFKKLFYPKKTTGYSKTNGLSKIQYFEKYQVKKLFSLLYEAEELLVQKSITEYDVDFLKFKNALIEEIYEVEGNNIADFTKIWNWFKPNKEWGQFTESNGYELGSQIFNITNNWKIDDDFISGTKIFLDNDFGVVLDN